MMIPTYLWLAQPRRPKPFKAGPRCNNWSGGEQLPLTKTRMAETVMAKDLSSFGEIRVGSSPTPCNPVLVT